MRRHLDLYTRYQVFLNYPFDSEFAPLEDALHFPIVAAGMLPLCAKDLSTPDHPRLEMIVDAIWNSHYSVHELSRSTRMNMPIEMGMAMFHALRTQRSEHRCAFLVPTPHQYQALASDLAGLDPMCHNNDDVTIVIEVYNWLRRVVPATIFNSQPTIEVVAHYKSFKKRLGKVKGSGENGVASHEERRELMYQLCAKRKWWDWRSNKAGREEFPTFPIAWKV
jgi:hypothetical protein